MLSRLRSYGTTWADLSRDARLVLWYTVVDGIGFSIMGLFSNLYILSLGYQPDLVGLLLTVNALPAILLSLPVGLVANRLGLKRTLVIGRGGLALSLVALSLSTSQPGLIIARLLGGCAQVMVNVALYPLLTHCCEPDARPMLFSAQRAAQTLIGVIGSMVGGWLPAAFALLLVADPESALAYRSTMLFSTGFMFLALWPLSRLSDPPTVVVSPDRRSPGVRHSLPRWGRIILPRVLVMIGAGLFVPFMNVFFKEEIGVSNAQLGTIFAMANLITGIATLGGPAVARRLGTVRAIVALRIVPLPLMLILAFSRSLPLVVLTHWARTAITRMTDPLSYLFVMEQVDEEERPVMSGLAQTFDRTGSSIMPYFSGLIQVRYGFGPLFVGAGIIYLISALLMYALFGHTDARKSDSLQEP